jgi:DNA-binding winged helix-turn-helix (wHTH) protein/TolB-like protein/tetratricopeptide (TPR) repeat protein
MSDQPRVFYEFGPFHLDSRERVLLRNGERVALTPKVFDTLLALVQSGGKLVEKDALMRLVWPDTAFVEEGNLTNNIFVLRKSLGETTDHRYIETVPKRGYRFVAEVREVCDTDAALMADQGARTKAIRVRRFDTRLVAGILLAGLIAATSWLVWRRLERTPRSGVESLAVLPFKPLSEDSETALLGVGMADSLITRLGSLRQMRVRPTSAVQKYADLKQSPLAAGSEQRVDAVLEGTIHRSGERIRVTVRLLRVSDGSLLWSGVFADRFTGLYTVEDSISQGVASALSVSVSPEEKKRVGKRYTTNTEAFQAYARGRYYCSTPDRKALDRAIECFREAIDKDPGYALAWAGLAYAYDELGGMGYEPPSQVASKGEYAAEQALTLDDSLGSAHASLGMIAFRFHYDRVRAEREFKRALDLSPNEAAIHYMYGIYLALVGRTQEAQAQMNSAVELDPLCLHYQIDCAFPLFCAGQHAAAVQVGRKALEADPQFYTGHFNLGLAYLANHQFPEALAEFQKSMPPEGDLEVSAAIAHVEALQGNRAAAYRILHRLSREARERYIPPASIALIHAALGEKDQAFQWLEQAYKDRSWWLVFLKVDPRFDSLRSDRRFETLLQRVGLAP